MFIYDYIRKEKKREEKEKEKGKKRKDERYLYERIHDQRRTYNGIGNKLDATSEFGPTTLRLIYIHLETLGWSAVEGHQGILRPKVIVRNFRYIPI